MSSAKKLLEAAAGNAGGAGLDIAEVFSTYLYNGTGADLTIANGVDLSGEGGMVWLKGRLQYSNHFVYDTERGVGKSVGTNTTGAQQTRTDDLKAFNSNGFSLGNYSEINTNYSSGGVGYNYASWTFRKAPKFFDIVTYTGNGASGRLIDHNLGSAPGMVTIKSTSTSGTNWSTYHRSTTANNYVILNTTAAQAGNGFDRTVSSTQYELGPNWADENQNGRTYVAYFFAHNNNDGEFGPDADQDIIKCGSFAYDNGNTPAASVTLGWEPQWVLTKNRTGSGNWNIHDSMRGMLASARGPTLYPDNSNNESDQAGVVLPNSTGFTVANGVYDPSTHIYMAIRAPMITPPAAATDVFEPTEYTGNNQAKRTIGGILLDMNMVRFLDGGGVGVPGFHLWDRLNGPSATLRTYLTAAESTGWAGNYYNMDQMTGWRNGTDTSYLNNGTVSGSYVSYLWKRAKGYFDVVCYTGTGGVRTVTHSLGVVPEMMWIKNRDTTIAWAVYHKDIGNAQVLFLNDDQGDYPQTSIWNSTTPTNTNFTIGTYANAVNQSGADFVAYLFATLDGISKVGSVSHSGSSTDVNCGFSNGARFVMLKRTDASGDWYVWDSARGIVSGNDPYALMNTADVQVTNTDYIDPLSSGFTITGDFTDGTYIFYAIA